MILDLLRQLSVDEKTLVIFSSDNGAHKEGGHDPGFWNSTGGLRGHKRDMHEGGIRVPMLARWPSVIQPGQTTAHLSGFQDILPTMAELVGQPIPRQADGISFLPLLKGASAEQKTHDFLYWEFCDGANKIISQAVRQGNWKGFRPTGKPMEVYNLDQDPFETNDLAKDMPDKVMAMQVLMTQAHTPPPKR